MLHLTIGRARPHTQHGNIQGFYKVPGSHNNQAKELNCKTCANYGKEAAQCALPIALPTATPTPQQIQQAMFQTGLRCIGPDPVKQSLQRIFNPMGALN